MAEPKRFLPIFAWERFPPADLHGLHSRLTPYYLYYTLLYITKHQADWNKFKFDSACQTHGLPESKVTVYYKELDFIQILLYITFIISLHTQPPSFSFIQIILLQNWQAFVEGRLVYEITPACPTQNGITRF
jgi:hypothetical protein